MEILQTVDPNFLSTTVLMMYINTGVRCDICIFECGTRYKWENIADCDNRKILDKATHVHISALHDVKCGL